MLRTEDGETTLTIGAIEVRDYKGPTEALISYPTASVRVGPTSTMYLHSDQLETRNNPPLSWLVVIH